MGNSNASGDDETAPLTGSSGAPSELRRQQICGELLSTEETYIRGLTTLDRYYRTALLEAGEKQATVDLIFSSLPQILQVHYNQMLPKLQLRCTAQSPQKNRWCVAQVFIDFAANLELYSTFVNNYERAQAEVARACQKKSVAMLFNNAKSLGEAQGLDFHSLFVTVVQRVPRYLLLLEELQRHVPPGDGESRRLAAALALIAAAASSINDKKAEFEDHVQLTALGNDTSDLPVALNVPGRRIVESAPLGTRHGAVGAFKNTTYYLFNDSVLFVRPALIPIGRSLTAVHFSYLKDTELCEHDGDKGVVLLEDTSRPDAPSLTIQVPPPAAAWIQKVYLARSRVPRDLARSSARDVSPAERPKSEPTINVVRQAHSDDRTPGCFGCA